MPISRKRSCTQCRKARTRCSRSVPHCSRCVERGLLCDYVELSLRSDSSPYARPTHSSALRPFDEVVSPGASIPTFEAFDDIVGVDPIASLTVPSDYGVDEDATTGLQPPSLSSPRHTGHVSTFILDSFDPAALPQPPCYEFPNLLDIRNPSLHTTMTASPTSASIPPARVRLLNGPIPQGRGTLRKRHSPMLGGGPSAKIMLGQIESYPKMLIEGLSLPPFIHSRCFQDDKPAFDCQAKRCHQCLPETLSICTSLVRMFYSKTEANSTFVWKMIYAEQARLECEFRDYDHETLLEALQSVCIYIILQAVDHESLEVNDTRSLITVISHMGTRLYVECADTIHRGTSASPLSRREWLFYESLCRTFCLLLLVESLLELIIGRVEDHCSGYHELPLPCTRELWEVESTAEWSRRYKESLRRRKSSQVLNIQGFMSTQIPGSSRLETDPDREALMADVATWCQGVDHYGILLWMAMSMKSA